MEALQLARPISHNHLLCTSNLTPVVEAARPFVCGYRQKIQFSCCPLEQGGARASSETSIK